MSDALDRFKSEVRIVGILERKIIFSLGLYRHKNTHSLAELPRFARRVRSFVSYFCGVSKAQTQLRFAQLRLWDT